MQRVLAFIPVRVSEDAISNLLMPNVTSFLCRFYCCVYTALGIREVYKTLGAPDSKI